MPLTITKRQIDFNPNLTFKPKTVGEEHFARIAVGVSGCVVSSDEFNALLRDDAAFKHFYKTPKDSDPVPRFETFAYLPLSPFDDAVVSLYVARRVMKLKNVNVVGNKILLLPSNPVWQFTLQALPGLAENERGAVIDLLLKLGDKGQIEIDCETYGQQPSLPLEEDPEEADEDDAEEATAPSRMQRNIEANEDNKRARKSQ